MPRHISDTTTHAISGEWGIEDFGPNIGIPPTFVLPTVLLLPVITHNDGQIVYIVTSGMIGVTEGGIWKFVTRDTTEPVVA